MVEIRLAENDRERADAFAVRHRVFVEEQGVDEDLEYDEHDAEATHFVAYDDGEPIGRPDFGRSRASVAKSNESRSSSRAGEGIGRALMETLEDEAESRGLSSFILHSQTRVAEFYRRLGYERCGPEFEEAGIPHVEMQK